jgi:hypothetical protein
MCDVAERVRGLEPGRTVDDVVARLLAIERERDGYANPERRRRRYRHPDGVACFNYMYLRVTQEVQQRAAEFASPALVERLAVVFAEFYLVEHDAAAVGAWVSPAWRPLFETCDKRGVAPLQFALAGMNAHINNDLPWALLQAWNECGAAPEPDSPDHRDYEQVNEILEDVAGGVRATLESGLLRFLDRLLGRLDDICATVVISRAREEAWRRAARWHRTFDPESAAAHERHVGYESHLILAA